MYPDGLRILISVWMDYQVKDKDPDLLFTVYKNDTNNLKGY